MSNAAHKRKPPCKCRLCKRARRTDRIVKQRDPEKMAILLVWYEDALSLTEDTLDYKKAILDGSWDTAVEQLESALVKAREKRAAP